MNRESDAMLRVSEMGCSLDGHNILEDVGFNLAPGEILGLIGPNGAGKSTLLSCLMAYHPYSGSISLGGNEIRDMLPLDRARMLSFVGQQGPDAMSFSALEVVEMGGYALQMPVSSADLCGRASRALDYVGMGSLANRPFNRLSGGEQQMVLFARVLLQDASLILLDEPTANLDIGHEAALLEMVEELGREGRSIIMAIHNLNAAAEYCSRLLLLKDGRIIADGSPREVLTPGMVSMAYESPVTVTLNGITGSPQVLHQRRFPGPGSLRVHIIGGGGSAVNLTRMLVRNRVSLSGGVTHSLDSDARLWESLGVPRVEVAAFNEIDDEHFSRARELMVSADYTILCPFPVGRGNLRNLELALESDRLLILDDGTHSFHTAGAKELTGRVRAHGRLMKLDEILALVQRDPGSDEVRGLSP